MGCMSRIRLAIGWLLATAAATALTFGAVSIVAGDISEQPRELAASTPAGEGTTTSSEAAVSSEGSESSTTTSPTSTTVPVGTSSSVGSPSTEGPDEDVTTASPPTIPSTTVPPGSVPTTSPSPTTAALSEFVEDAAGNWATFACSSDIASIVSSAPVPGFSRDGSEVGGSEAKVEFTSSDGSVEVKLRVKCEDGSIETWAEVDVDD